MDSIPERRDFERISIELAMEVAAEDKEGKKYREKALLKNISGEGARFVTQHADRYFLGQHLEINIHLPGTDDVKACMRGRVTVERIDIPTSSTVREKSEETDIAVKIQSRLYFERVDNKTHANHKEPTKELSYY